MINKKSLDIRIRPRIFAKLMLPVQAANMNKSKVTSKNPEDISKQSSLL
jgi:hypothetical protein